MATIIGFTLQGQFGCFRKPDTNEGVMTTYNTLHKPGFLGILGAIIGLEGYQAPNRLPEYYRKLQHLKIGIEPVLNESISQPVFDKVLIEYNNSTGLAASNRDEDEKKDIGVTLQVSEQVLYEPRWRCYLLIESGESPEKEIAKYLKNQETVYIPYLGKNENRAWWSDVQEYHPERYIPEEPFQIHSFIRKGDKPLNLYKSDDFLFDAGNSHALTLFERLPVSMNTEEGRHDLDLFAYTTGLHDPESDIPDLYRIEHYGEERIIQLF